jgi:hypothetical protein
MSLCRVPDVKSLFVALYGISSLTLIELKHVLQHSTEKGPPPTATTAAAPAALNEGDVRKQKRRKRVNSSEGDRPDSVKKQGSNTQVGKTVVAAVVATKNYFAPPPKENGGGRGHKNWKRDGVGAPSPPTQQKKSAIKATERPPPIILTATVNLLKFQAEIKAITSGCFELRNIRNGIRVMTREMADYSAIMRHLDALNLPYFTYHSKSLKPVKAVIRHLPGDTPGEENSNELVALGFNIIIVRQITASRRLPTHKHLSLSPSLFMVTLAGNEKSPEIFKLISLSHGAPTEETA